MKIEVKGGVIVIDGVVAHVGLADRIAEANGFVYAERFVNEYAGKTVELDDHLKIKKEI